MRTNLVSWQLCTLAMAVLLCFADAAKAACIESTPGNFSCTDTSNVSGDQLGQTVLNNTSSPAVLNLNGTSMNSYIEPLGAVISNSSSSLGQFSTITSNGSQAIEINNTGEISVVRTKAFTTTLNAEGQTVIDFQAINGKLFNDNEEVGVAAAIHLGPDLSSAVINNNTSADFVRGLIYGKGAFSAGIYGNSKDITINVQSNASEGSIKSDNIEFPVCCAPQPDLPKQFLLERGNWAIATYGGASVTAPVVQDGTTSATVNSAGLTTININGASTISGSVLIIDTNPLLKAAQIINPNLALEFKAEEVGPRDSVINNYGNIGGYVYLGSGAHTINALGSGYLSNVYVDQAASWVTDAAGNKLYSVAGARTFDYNESVFGATNIYINDVVESVNHFNFTGLSDGVNDIITNGLGTNVYKANTTNSLYLGNLIGMSSIDIKSNFVVFGNSDSFIRAGDAPKVVESRTDINIDARSFSLEAGATLKANNIIFDNFSLLKGGWYFATDPLVGGTTTIDAIGDIDGNLVFKSGQINLQSAVLDVSGDATFTATDIVTVFKPRGLGRIEVAGNGTISSDSTIIPTLAGGFVTNGKTYVVIRNTTGTPFVVNQPGGRVHFTLADDPDDIAIKAVVTLPETVLGKLTTAGRNAVDALFSYRGNDLKFMKFAGEVLATSDIELGRVSERLRPEIHDGAIRMAFNHTDRVFGVLDSHLFDSYMSWRDNKAYLASVSEQQASDTGIWMQGFGGAGVQERAGNIDGYASTSTGLAGGADQWITPNLRLGAAWGYAWGNIDNRGVTDNNYMNINSYLGAVYAAYGHDDYYLNASLGLGKHRYQSKRIALGRAAYGDHDSWQLNSRIDAGWPYKVNEQLTLVPISAFNYTHIREEAYSESGETIVAIDNNGGYPPPTIDLGSPHALTLEARQFNSYRAGLGGKAIFSLQMDDWHAGIELRAMLHHEFGDLAQDNIARLVAGGNTFKSPGAKLDRDGLLIGSTLRLTGDDQKDQLTLLASYDADLRSQYVGQSFSMMLRYDFDQAETYKQKAKMRKEAMERPLASSPVKATERDIASLSAAMRTGEPEALDPVSQQVSMALEAWATAMTNNQLDRFFSSYASSFTNSDGITRQQWERKQRASLTKASHQQVSIAYLKVIPQGQQASAIFTQTTQRGDDQEISRKFMEFEQRDGRWLILSEDSVPISQTGSH